VSYTEILEVPPEMGVAGSRKSDGLSPKSRGSTTPECRGGKVQKHG
jgi:hypothetical protein